MRKFELTVERVAQISAAMAAFVFLVTGVVYLYLGSFTATHADFWSIYEFYFGHSWLETAALKDSGTPLFFPNFFWLASVKSIGLLLLLATFGFYAYLAMPLTGGFAALIPLCIFSAGMRRVLRDNDEPRDRTAIVTISRAAFTWRIAAMCVYKSSTKAATTSASGRAGTSDDPMTLPSRQMALRLLSRAATNLKCPQIARA